MARMSILVTAVITVAVQIGCGGQLGMRRFAGPVEPVAPQASAEMTVGDDRGITYTQGRLEINLRPLTDEILNRQLAAYAPDKSSFYLNPYEFDLNPFTYGDYTPPESRSPTKRFTVFNLKVKNYEYPKVLLDPGKIRLVASNGREYEALSLAAMVEYYWPYAIAYAGNTYLKFEERKDLLTRTLYKREQPIFSGQDYSGFVVFPPLHKDVTDFVITIDGVAVRFDFRNEPVETVDLAYQFNREVYVAKQPKEGHY